MGSGPENRFRTRLIKELKLAFGSDVYIQLHHGSVYGSGLPDMLALSTFGQTVFLELKATDGSMWTALRSLVTPLQKHTLRSIVRAGGNAGVVVYSPKERMAASVHGGEMIRCFEGTQGGFGLVCRFDGNVNPESLKQLVWGPQITSK